MHKPIVISLLVFLVMSVGLYFLLTHAHVDIFEGVKYSYTDVTGMQIEDKGYVSLLEVKNPQDARNYAELTTVGYITAFLVIIGLPALLAFSVYLKLQTKNDPE